MDFQIIRAVKEKCITCGKLSNDYARFPNPDHKCMECFSDEISEKMMQIFRTPINLPNKPAPEGQL